MRPRLHWLYLPKGDHMTMPIKFPIEVFRAVGEFILEVNADKQHAQ